MKYEYGVEYKTNGVRPDIDRDVLVEIKTFDGTTFKSPVGNNDWGVSGYNSDIVAFKIVDECYKTEPESNWYERGELPPERIEVEVLHDGRWVGAFTIGEFGDYKKCMVCAPNGGGFYGYYAEQIRPIRSEQDKFTNNLAKHIKDVGDSVSFAVEGYEFAAKEMIKFFEENGWGKPYED